MNNNPPPMELEKYLFDAKKASKYINEIPTGALRAYYESNVEGVTTAIGKHPKLGYFVLWTAGQGPGFAWTEWILPNEQGESKYIIYLRNRTNHDDDETYIIWAKSEEDAIKKSEQKYNMAFYYIRGARLAKND